MAYRPRTPEDANRLAAAVAQYPHIITESGDYQAPPPTGMRPATVADAAALGLTPEDIMRAQSSPARYGPIYARAQQEAKTPAPRTATDNAKRTQTRDTAAGRGNKGGRAAPREERAVSANPTDYTNILGQILAAGAATAAGYKAADYIRNRGTKTLPPEVAGDVPRLTGPGSVKMLPPGTGGESTTTGNLVRALTGGDEGIIDAIWRDAAAPSRIPGSAATALGPPGAAAPAGTAAVADATGRAALPSPPLALPPPVIAEPPEAPRAAAGSVIPLPAPEPTTEEIIREAVKTAAPRRAGSMKRARPPRLPRVKR